MTSAKHPARILLFDIETAPMKSYHWGMWDQNIPSKMNIDEWYVMSIAWKWHGQTRTYCKILPDFKTYKKQPMNDKLLMELIADLFDQADIVIGHNGDKFDIRKLQARMCYHDIDPPSPFASVDTLKVARRHFAFSSNRLNDLGVHLGLGEKVDTGGFELWEGCMKGVKKCWALMKKYNLQDVDLLDLHDH